MTPTTTRPASTIKEFQERYRVNRGSVYNWAKSGELRLTKIGPQATRILPEDEDAWLARRREVVCYPATPSREEAVRRREAQA